jgi:uncharacterized membrane protein
MILAAVGDTGYNIMLVLHILTAMAALAPAFTNPMLTMQTKAEEGSLHQKVMGLLVANGRKIYAPALILTGLFGFGVQGMSDDAWGFDQGWLLSAVIVWVAMNGVLHGVITPGERALSEGDESGLKKAQAGGGAITILLIVMLWLMVFKPGL